MKNFLLRRLLKDSATYLHCIELGSYFNFHKMIGMRTTEYAYCKQNNMSFEMYLQFQCSFSMRFGLRQATQERLVQRLDWEEPLEWRMVTHSSILAQRSLGQRNLASYSPWGCKQLDTTEQQSTHTYISKIYILEFPKYQKKNTQFFTELQVYRLQKPTPSFPQLNTLMLFSSQLSIMIYGLKGNQHKSFNKRKREKKEGREGGRKEKK